jgi:putative intracellular protease/amidase
MVAVMRQRHMSFLMIDFNRLAIIAVCTAGCAIPCMTDSHGSLWKGVKDTAAENITDQTCVFMGSKHPVVVDHDTAAFLSAMLQGIEPKVYHAGNVLRLFCHNAEYTAFFMDTHHSTRSFSE